MPATLTVSTLAQLYSALATASSGQTILLEGGNYGDLYLGSGSGFDITFPTNVTIKSASATNPAVFSSANVIGAANLTFDGISFDYTFEAGDRVSTAPFIFSNSNNITIRNSTFDGDNASGLSSMDNGYGAGIGLVMRYNTGVVIENNEISGFWKGLTITGSDQIVVAKNELSGLRSDGMGFSDVDGVVIEGNYIHDFREAPDSLDHPDMIQFITRGTTSPSTDITIRGNILDIGAGSSTQGIFMGNEAVRGGAGTGMYYQNVVITDNVLVNARLNGIAIGEANGLTISNNSVLHADGGLVDGLDAKVEIPRIRISSISTDVTIINNATSTVTGWSSQGDWTVGNNAFIQDQDPNAPGYYGDVFIPGSLQLIDGVNSFVALTGGMLDILNAGASQTLNPDYVLIDPVVPVVPVVVVDAEFQVVGREKVGIALLFDASLSTSDLGQLPDGTAYLWSFGDGTTASGLQVKHIFAKGGDYGVTLTVTLPDGTTDTQLTSIGISNGTRAPHGTVYAASSVSDSTAPFEATLAASINDKAGAVQDAAAPHVKLFALMSSAGTDHRADATATDHSHIASNDRMALADHQMPESAMHPF